MSTELMHYSDDYKISDREMANAILTLVSEHKKQCFINYLNLEGEFRALTYKQEVFATEYPNDENPFLIPQELSQNRDKARIAFSLMCSVLPFTQEVLDKYFSAASQLTRIIGRKPMKGISK